MKPPVGSRFYKPAPVEPSDDVIEANKKPRRKDVIAALGFVGAAAVVAWLGVEALDSNIQQQSEDGKKWFEEAEQAQRQLDFENGRVSIDLDNTPTPTSTEIPGPQFVQPPTNEVVIESSHTR